MKCSPCYHPHCIKGFACIRKITVDEVHATITKFLTPS